jgi:cytidylate kinase
MIIAIDGPAASGKGTLAKRLAAHYGLPHLDTGLLYRAVARHVLDAKARLDDAEAAERAAEALTADDLDDAHLRDEGMGDAASIVSAHPGVRERLLAFQRDFAAQLPGAVLDGRDIGTVVCPLAEVKLFITATAEERARRRHLELVGRGMAADFTAILEDIRRRDERDRSRATAPLKPAADALTLDTTSLDADAAFRAALALVDERRKI